MFKSFLFTIFICLFAREVSSQTSPEKINFVRQGVKRLIFDENQAIPLSSLDPKAIVGFSSMYPRKTYSEIAADLNTEGETLIVQSPQESETAVWFGGFNPFATYTVDLESCLGSGEIGFQFSDSKDQKQFIVKVAYKDNILTDVKLKVTINQKTITDQSIAVNKEGPKNLQGKIILQMLGSGLNLYIHDQGLPKVIGQSDFNNFIDLRKKEYIHSLQSQLYLHLINGQVQIKKVDMALTTGVGLADIRTITYENGDPMLDQGRLWYTMSIRGRALPHHIQGVFSMDPTVFDIKLEGVILFDRKDGLLRNEIASHLFYDRNEQIWRGLTTGFSAYAFPDKEKKQLLAIESKRDPRFGFSVMDAVPFGMVGDIEDPHILFDEEVNKWRMLTCENQGQGYKAIVLESDYWNKGYTRISGPVAHNSTGTSIQKIGDSRYCFSGSSEREIFIYSYPDLKEVGTLKMDLPPWDSNAGTRVWPNIVQLPEGYPSPYIALMMDRYNYPGLTGPNWTYGALYLYHAYDQ
ncbi:hypothetical protein KZP23_21075 [Echinicola marina]|nr:hypothetical protein KZP23_21075 [Echinicola marina]